MVSLDLRSWGLPRQVAGLLVANLSFVWVLVTLQRLYEGTGVTLTLPLYAVTAAALIIALLSFFLPLEHEWAQLLMGSFFALAPFGLGLSGALNVLIAASTWVVSLTAGFLASFVVLTDRFVLAAANQLR